MTKNIMTKVNNCLITMSLVALIAVLSSAAYSHYQNAEYSKQARKTSEQIERTSKAQEEATKSL